jgi:hypothetical protein
MESGGSGGSMAGWSLVLRFRNIRHALPLSLGFGQLPSNLSTQSRPSFISANDIHMVVIEVDGRTLLSSSFHLLVKPLYPTLIQYLSSPLA